jgi:AcrR family transcriptional regulator
MQAKRKPANERREEVLSVALQLAVEVGYTRITRERISSVIGITKQAIQHHIGTVAELRRDVMQEAIARECLPVIAQGMALRDPLTLSAPAELLGRARAAL